MSFLVHAVIFVAGTRFYVVKKPKKEAALLYLNVPLSIAVSYCIVLYIDIATLSFSLSLPPSLPLSLSLSLSLSLQTAIYRRIRLGKVEGKKNILQYACPRFSVSNQCQEVHMCVWFLVYVVNGFMLCCVASI